MIDWFSLIIVAVVSVGVTAIFAVLLSFAIKLFSVAQGAQETDEGRFNVRARATVGAWTMLGLIGVMVLFGLYLIVPQFH